MKIVVVGDAMIPARFMAGACDRFKREDRQVVSLAWLGEEDKVRLQEERIKVEKGGPDAVPVPQGLAEAVRGQRCSWSTIARSRKASWRPPLRP